MLESDDDTPDDTHTQRALARYYLSTEGALPPWLPPPTSLTSTSTSHRPSNSSASGGSTHRAGSKPVSLQDIYDSADANQSSNLPSRMGRNQDMYVSDQGVSARQPLAGDRLRNKLRPSNSRPSQHPESGDQDRSYNYKGSGGYSGRSAFGGGDDYDPYNYQQNPGYEANRSRDPRQGQHSGGQPNRSGGRR